MDNLISRQAAIEALDRIGSLDTDADREYARQVFEQLPSAQPEIIRCRDCKRWNTVLDRNIAKYGLCQKRSQLEATKRDFFCGSAEREEDAEKNNQS